MIPLLLLGRRREIITESWSATLNLSVNWAALTLRQIMSAASISTSGTSIKVVVQAHATTQMVIKNVSIVERSSGTSNGTTTPTEILFSAGSGVTVNAGETATSDWLAFTLDETKDYLLICDVGSTSVAYANSGEDGYYYKSGVSSYNVQNLVGATLSAGFAAVFNSLSVK